jgi:hypothetical protein
MRQSMSHLPEAIQPFLTWLTGEPSLVELNRWDGVSAPHPIYHVFAAFAKLGIGVGLSIIGLNQIKGGFEPHDPILLSVFAGIVLFAAGFVLTTSAFRKLQVVIYHNCAHNIVFKNNLLNRILGTSISIIAVLKNFDQYQIAHRAHHAPKTLLTREDDTLLFITDQLGIKPTDSIETMWRKLITTMFSPLYHARSALARIASCFFTSGTRVSWIAIAVWSAVLWTAISTNSLQELALIWLLPLFIGYQVSVAMRLCAEHRWPTEEHRNHRGKEFIAYSTSSVFMGEELRAGDNSSGNAVELTRWIFKMLIVHLFFRVFVMVGDTPCHDYHHRRTASPLWTRYAFARAHDKRNGCQGFSVNYIDSWGLIPTITRNFESFRATSYSKEQST